MEKGKREIIAEKSFYPSILDLLTVLVDNNALVLKEQADGNVRLQMLEVVREFAFEILRETGELDDLKKNHAGFFFLWSKKPKAFCKGKRAKIGSKIGKRI